jgi:hypothetical protein
MTSFAPNSLDSQATLSDEQLQSLSLRELRDRLRVVRRVALRRNSRRDLADFSRYVYSIEPGVHHLLWIEALEALHSGSFRRLLVIAPPGHAKSTYHSIIYPSWYLGQHPNDSLIGVTTTDLLGRLYGDTVRTVIEQSPEFRAVFPGVEPDKGRGWAQDGFFIRGPNKRPRGQKDASMIYTGAGGPVIGRRADGVLIDDAVDEATARSELLLEHRKTWIRRSVFSRLKPDGWRIIAGTMWAENDVVDSAMQTGEYVTIHMAARAPGTLVQADVWIPNGVQWRPSRRAEAS